ncbi:response regulator [Pseudomonas sp. CFSAN084952]|uniref:response regulator n=1 Tax=Pseudomonas TaxID=286 RepID=UPI0012999E71|nr:response regulator [Pseudomonas sp. CFSAN084952]QGF91781.1 response regulator [Pseudomonas sp. CFSAN084952]
MPLTPIKLLLIEDSVHDVELTLLALERHGLVIKPVVVHDHHGAKMALQQQKFDAIISDSLLPSSSGLEVFEAAKELAPTTPFIFLSGMSGEQYAAEALRLGASDYVLKHNLKLLPKILKRAVAEVSERNRRVEAELALEEVEARARLAIEAADMGVWELNLTTMQVIWDERCTVLYELPPGTLLDLQQALDQTHPNDIEMLSVKVEKAIEIESNFSAEYRILLPGNRVKWLNSNGRSLFRDGRCIRFSGVIQDITERKQASNALEERNETLGESVEQRTRERDRTWELSRELLAALKFDMTLVAFNPAWQAALGWSRDEMAAMRLWELVHPDDVDSTVRVTREIAQGQISTRFVNRMRHASGQYRWLSWTIVPDAGLMYAAVRDITEERVAAQALEALNERLMEQIREREKAESALQQMQRLEVVGQLTAGIAHDFNNLLTIILSGTALAKKACDRGALDKVAARLDNIRGAGERGAKLTAQLLSFSRKQRLDPVPVDLNDILLNMEGLLAKALGPSVWLETDLADDLWMASADPTQTEMIILNLAINARDAIGLGGTLSISTHNQVIDVKPKRSENPEPGSYTAISVKDTGTGMTPEILQKVFEPFFTTKPVGKGSGLGLAQVFGFAKQSGGGVSIQSELGKGTTVTVYLPRTNDANLVVDDMPSQYDSLERSFTILLVDDDDSVRAVAAMILESLGHTVRESRSGADAIKMLNNDIDLLITDYAMPGMTGAELVNAIRPIYPMLPVVFITGFADFDALGLTDGLIIQKPFNERELQAKIDLAMSTRFT